MIGQFLNGIALGAGFAVGSIAYGACVQIVKNALAWMIGADDTHGR